MSISAPEHVLLDVNLKYYSTTLVVVDPDDRELCWKRLFIMLTNAAPHLLYRTGLTSVFINNFDYKSPLYVNLIDKHMVSNDDTINLSLKDYYDRSMPLKTLNFGCQTIMIVGVFFLIIILITILSEYNFGYNTVIDLVSI
ncbi:hypothetical protein [Neodiprion abietis nucleopolyhedrovirus]|uniref:Per os infectivity factor 6 n=1 Tax=Neodiprion abietis nucleopolyhedrovirus TaxID=204507 RepID=Q0ZP40_9CBAC|nr:hypothetical protein [Neodiprion abietis nucleopolyhedrovirus]ABC74914.1 unknown [Neodiprion abietis nucleopolyhedrovirus]